MHPASFLRFTAALFLLISVAKVDAATVRVTLQIKATPAGAKATIDGKPVGVVPEGVLPLELKEFPLDERKPHLLRLEMNGFAPLLREISYIEAKTNSKTPGVGKTRVWQIELPPMAEVLHSFPLEIKANVPGASIVIDDKEVGSTAAGPFKSTLVFARPDGKTNWPLHTVKVLKDGMEYRPPGAVAEAAFTKVITFESATKSAEEGNGTLIFNVEHLEPLLFVSVPLRTVELVQDHSALVRTNAWSAVDPGEPGRRLEIVSREQGTLVVSRISVSPDNFEKFYFSMPIWDARAPAGQANPPGELVAMGVNMLTSNSKAPITDAAIDRRSFDLDPFVTADGRWLYYSSDRLRSRNIWRVATDGTGGITQITRDNNSIDIEPAVSPDGQKLAYASRPVGASVNANFYLWIANEDGTRAAQYRQGRNPAWSHDSKRLAFVSPDNKIWIMYPDGSKPAFQITTTPNSKDQFPVWSANDKYIIYASDAATDDLGRRNSDIWRAPLNAGQAEQVTKNFSFDTAPAVSADGRYLYFFSNRGARKANDEALHIYRMDLPPE